MTVQDITITTGNPSISKIFSDSSTDGVWSGNVLLDSISSQSIGILQPNVLMSWTQPEYSGGCMAWRLQNAQTLSVSAFGFGALAGQNTKQYLAQPVRINPNDILTAFPLAKAASGTTASLAWVTTTKGVELFQGSSADNVSTSMTTAVNAQSLGDSFFNSTLQSIEVQCADDAQLDRIEIIDNMGGVVMTIQGGYRGTVGSSRSNYVNLSCGMLNIPIGKGFKLNIVTVNP
tara:strand:+ start:1261 stop:1956 length:696 start_codon:yes stop_codon:yes gene_type:complete